MTYWDELREAIAEMEAELDATGLEDALDWERFPEYERKLYALAEHELMEAEREHDREIAAEVAERDELIELVEMAEEAALDELDVFGCWDEFPRDDEIADFGEIRAGVEAVRR